MLCVLDLEFDSSVFVVLKQSISSQPRFHFYHIIPRWSEEHLYRQCTVVIMGSASSSQRGGKATQSQTVVRESTNANTPKDIPQVVRSRWVRCACAQPFSGC
jgi:hypothetical protein